MKKTRLISTFIFVLLLCFSLSAFANEDIFKLEQIGEYTKFATYHEEFATPHSGTVHIYNNIGIMDKDGNVVVEPIYRNIDAFCEGRAVFSEKESGKWGFFDENWNVAIKPIYTKAKDFSEGLASVADENGKYGYIDKDGNVVIPFTYDGASSFQNNVATVEFFEEGYNGNLFWKSGKIDKSGNVTEPIKYAWEKEYEIQMSQNNINISGNVFDNSTLAYPFINYLGYTYIPLTFHTAKSLGINSHWTREDGLILQALRRGGEPNSASLLGKNGMVKGKMYKAHLYEGTITINGKKYTSDDVYYPLLSFGDIVYIPLLWRQGMEDLGLTSSYDLETKSVVITTLNK